MLFTVTKRGAVSCGTSQPAPLQYPDNLFLVNKCKPLLLTTTYRGAALFLKQESFTEASELTGRGSDNLQLIESLLRQKQTFSLQCERNQFKLL